MLAGRRWPEGLRGKNTQLVLQETTLVVKHDKKDVSHSALTTDHASFY